MRESLFAKFLKFSYGSWVGLLLGLLTTVISTRLLLPEAFGKASMFDLFLQVGLILTIFGTDQSFIRFFYEEKPEKRGALLYNSLKLPVFTTIILLVTILIFYRPITYYLTGESNFSFALILIFGIVSQLLFRYGQLVIRMQQKGSLYSILQILYRLLNLIFIIVFFSLIGSNFKVLVFSIIITLAISAGISIYLEKEFWKLNNITITTKTKHSQLDIIRYGSPFVLTIFITWLFESFDKIALRQWSNFEELGLYSAAMRLVAIVMVLKTTFSTFWTPVAYEKFEKAPEEKHFFKNVTIIVSFVMFLVAIISIAGKDIIVILLGAHYREAALIMPFLVLMPILYTISETTVVGINFYKKTKWHIVVAGMSCIANVIGNWLLVPDYGAIGASLSTAVSFIIFFTLRTQISIRYYKVNYPLIKIYLMVTVVFVYAVHSIIKTVFWINLILGILNIVLLILLFYKDLMYIIKNAFYKNQKNLK